MAAPCAEHQGGQLLAAAPAYSQVHFGRNWNETQKPYNHPFDTSLSRLYIRHAANADIDPAHIDIDTTYADASRIAYAGTYGDDGLDRWNVPG